MRLVVDASVAVKWLVEEEGTEAADRLLKFNYDLHAPRLLASEVANALWRKVRLGEIAKGDAGVLAAAVTEMPLRWSDDERICADSIRLALELERPVYDCVYLALGHRIGATLVTADTRFANAVKATVHGGAVTTLTDLVVDPDLGTIV